MSLSNHRIPPEACLTHSYGIGTKKRRLWETIGKQSVFFLSLMDRRRMNLQTQQNSILSRNATNFDAYGHPARYKQKFSICFLYRAPKHIQKKAETNCKDEKSYFDMFFQQNSVFVILFSDVQINF